MTSHSPSLTQWCQQLGGHQPLYLAVIDARTRLGFVNSHFYRAFQQMAMPGHDYFLSSLIDGPDLDAFQHALLQPTNHEGEIIIRVRMKHGHGKWVQWHWRPLGDASRSQREWIGLGYELPKEDPPSTGPKTDPKAMRQKNLAESILRAQQEERARIGHELHDNVNQILTSAHLYLSCLHRDSADFDYVKTKAMEIILHAVEEVRHLSREMILPDFREKGLTRSIEELAAELRYTNLLDVDFRQADVLTIESQDQQLKLALFRIIQEQIKNILKHSYAKQAVISLHVNNEQVRLLIRDNGIGFDPVTIKNGLGLSGIRERTTLFGGKLMLDAAPGKGCSLIITIPLELKKFN